MAADVLKRNCVLHCLVRPISFFLRRFQVEKTDHFSIFNLWPDCILGVTFFGDASPDSFGAFDLAFITMFRVAGGEPWPWETLPAKESDGTTNFGVIFFFISYVVLVNWTLLQVHVARSEIMSRNDFSRKP